MIIHLSKLAVKDFEKLPKSVQERINEGMICLKEDPYTSRHHLKLGK
jgi:mRNA-degrading endonuclease RelE of RelBE toxin-antitoxin system